MATFSFTTYADWLNRVNALGGLAASVYFYNPTGYFECGVLTTEGAGLRHYGTVKPASFALDFPLATEVDAMTW